jgi:hypothetical protein
MPLSPDEIAGLLSKTATGATKTAKYSYHINEQFGPLRWFEKEMRCACKGCNSPTYCKVEGIPRCMIHALRELNDLLVAVEYDV